MKKQTNILITIITLLVFLLGAKGPLFAVSAPVYTETENIDFSGRGVDEDRTTASIEDGVVKLSSNNNGYNSSAVVWTDTIDFREDIKSIIVTADSILPAGTNIRCYIVYGDQYIENRLTWGDKIRPDNLFEEVKFKIFLSTSNTSITPLLNSINITAELQDQSERGKERRDFSRMRELTKTKEILDDYYNDFGHYPIVTISKDNKTEQWRILRSILDSASRHRHNDYIRSFDEQPRGVSNEYKYGYLSNGVGSYYLLWTSLEQTDPSTAWVEDPWHGTKLGVECGPYQYCIYQNPYGNSTLAEDPVYLRDFTSENEGSANNNNNFYFSAGSFLRKNNDTKVYMEIAGKRFWLRTPSIFSSVGGSWDQVHVSNYLTSPLLKFVKKPNESKVYMVEQGFKRHILSPDVLHLYGSFGEIVAMSEGIVNALPEAKLLRAQGGDRVYYISGDTKRWITTPEILKAMGFNFSQVVEVKPRELDHYYEGQPIF